MYNDRSKTFLIKTLLLNDRLKVYKDYIEYAREHGYNVIPLEEFFTLPERRKAGTKNFVLRHDVDWKGNSTRKMFEVERECGVRSTYYFRFSTIDLPLIQEMKAAGFEVGFHFETISDYIKENDCTDKNQIDVAMLRQRFREDVLRFEELVGFDIASVCAHGHTLNKKLGISNNVITEDEELSKYGLLFEAYDREMYENDVDCHILDGRLTKNYGFQYKDNPYNAINASYQNIIFLSHPHNWTLSPSRRLRTFGGILLGQATFESNRTFQRIAK